ncbi:MAG: tRNA lysidine(34) synthetase TilS [Caldicoprobacter oshimai]|uniref:tRNA(Ile)-lysidine synthase n=1 Tax=Caldicoprobacter faecalis TaxID=937334 RepID=A0A1I5Y8C3_9FIRM|nr:tRNA lysidine(34) synthetase TilS [Caldicoprobacter faecalis]PZN09548.1 MAG: tRNA lysidine(34) synthetase TilS [Caldicoprobacter oshimai]SFQ40465.1 tRNA(Ile)-lysidine synthase [Caldicoprobacter faecalis]
MLAKVLHTIHKYNMLSPGERVLVGISGGPDSVALLHVLKRLEKDMGIEVYAAHVHHGIRGTVADRDAEFVAQLCQQWNVPLFVERVDVPRLADEWGLTLEEAGRIVRYRFFDKVLQDIRGHKVALGHNRDDQAETILHHILRGTGMQGLQGIKPVRQNKFIRPLIEVSRAEIEEYCHQNGLEFRVDATNQDVAYTRNRIRHELIPYIKRHFNPNIVDALVRMGAIIRDEEEFLQDYCQKEYDKLVRAFSQNKLRIDLDEFLARPIAVRRRVLRMALKSIGGTLDEIGANHVEDILDMALNSTTGAMLTLPNDIKALKDYDNLVVWRGEFRPSVPPFEYSLDVPGSVIIKECGIEVIVQRVQHKEVSFSSPWRAYIDGDVINGKLRVRNRRQGDRFKPFGMEGTKKLKEYFIDRKVPRHERDGIPLVVDEKNIIWVVGWQIHDDYKVTPRTHNIVKLEARRI